MRQPLRHLPFLDGIRGLAILVVFLFHAIGEAFGYSGLPWNGQFRNFDTGMSFLAVFPLTYGFVGVSVFFVVSGFCIHLSHQQAGDKGWLTFFNRRFFRIYPAYFITLCVFFFVSPWASHSPDSYEKLVQGVTHVLAVHNLDKTTFYGINPSFWSIACEIQLYAIYPVLLLMTSKIGWRKGLFLVGAIELSIRAAMSLSLAWTGESLPYFVMYSPFSFWLSWTLGAHLAQCYLEGRDSIFSRVRFDLTAVAAFSSYLFKPTAPFTFLAFALLTCVVIQRLISERWTIPTGPIFSVVWRHLALLGVVSYSFYLLHQPMGAYAVQKLKESFPGSQIHPHIILVFYTALYPVVLVVSVFFHRAVELPFISLGKAVGRKFRKPPVDIQAAGVV